MGSGPFFAGINFGMVDATYAPLLRYFGIIDESVTQQIFEGLGAFASKWGEVVGKNFDTPSTITIDQGTGIGVLITSDLEYGSDPVYYSPKPATTTAATNPQAGQAQPAPAGISGITPQQAAILLSTLQQGSAGASASTTPPGGK